MPSLKQKSLAGRLALFACTLIWGTSFVILKSTLDNVSAVYILAFRFTGAALILCIGGFRELKKINRSTLTNGALMGIFVFVAYLFQTFGLQYTTAGKNAFLTTTYCIITPFLYWLISHRKPDKYNVSAAVICLVGCGFVSLQEDLSVGVGDILTMMCGIFYALHIIVVANATEKHSPLLLTILQFAVAAVLAWIVAPFTGPFPTGISSGAVVSIIYLSVMCTAVCFFLQIFGQKTTPPSSAAVILTLESVFGALFSVVFFHEKLTVKLLIGFTLIFLSVLLSETKFEFLRIKKKGIQL